jgi:hypothetical protein
MWTEKDDGMILCRYEPGESDVVVEYSALTATFTVTLPFNIFVKHRGAFVNEISAKYPMEMIGYLWELQRDGFLVQAEIIETLRQISHRANTGQGLERFAPRTKDRSNLRLVA